MDSLTFFIVPDRVKHDTPCLNTSSFTLPIQATTTKFGTVITAHPDLSNPEVVSIQLLQDVAKLLAKKQIACKGTDRKPYHLSVTESRLLQAIGVHLDGIVTDRLVKASAPKKLIQPTLTQAQL